MNKKILSVILTLSMILTMIPAPAFASDASGDAAYSIKTSALDAVTDLTNAIISKSTIKAHSYSRINPLRVLLIRKYTSLGDSTVFGYGISEEGVDEMDLDSPIFINHFGLGVCSSAAYPVVLAKKLGLDTTSSYVTNCTKCEQSHNYYINNHGKNDLAQLAMGDLRAEDLLYILRNDNGVVTPGSYAEHIRGTDLVAYAGSKNANSFKETSAIFKSNIKNSDLVTLSIGGNNAGTFLNWLTDNSSWGNHEPGEKYALLDEELEKYQKTFGYKLYKLIDFVEERIKSENLSADIDASEIAFLAKYAVYVFVSTVVNVKEVLDEIHKINPRAIVVVTGLYNPVDEVSVQLPGATKGIKIGKIADSIVAVLNLSFRDYAVKHSSYCCYVDISDAELICDNTLVRESGIPLNIDNITELFGDRGINVHENAAGCRYIADQIYKTLYSVKLPEFLLPGLN